MSALDDAERYLQLHQAKLVSGDDPNTLIADLVDHFRKYGLRNQLVSDTNRLRAQLVELESRLSEANARTREVEHNNVRLEEALKAAQCQTLSVGSKSSMPLMQRLPSPEILTDRRLEDPNFVPCRDERCQQDGIHAAHVPASTGRGPRKRKQSDV